MFINKNQTDEKAIMKSSFRASHHPPSTKVKLEANTNALLISEIRSKHYCFINISPSAKVKTLDTLPEAKTTYFTWKTELLQNNSTLSARYFNSICLNLWFFFF